MHPTVLFASHKFFTKIVSKVTILTPFPTDVTKCLTTQLKEGWVLALGLRVQFITVERAWGQEHEVRKQRKDESWSSSPFLLVIQAAIPAHGIMSVHLGQAFPPQLNSMVMPSQRQGEACLLGGSKCCEADHQD